MSIVNSIKDFGQKNGGKIWFGLGTISLVLAIGKAIKSTPKAIKDIDAAEEEKNKLSDGEYEPLTRKEVFVAVWKNYILTFVFAGGAVACYALSNSEYKKEGVAAAAAFEIAKTSLDEYRHYKQSVVEEVGEEVEKKICEKVSQKKVDESVKPDSDSPVYNFTTNDEVTFYLEVPGSTSTDALYFKSTLNDVYYKFNQLNESLLAQSEVDMNDICAKFGVPPISYGNLCGYRPEITGQIQWRPNPIMIDAFHPGISIEFLTKPVDFRRSYI